MTIEMLKSNILTIVNDYPIKRITLFGSRAAGTDHEDSDVDLIMEFSLPISLLTLSMIKLKLEEILKISVDIVHGPIEELKREMMLIRRCLFPSTHLIKGYRLVE